LENDQPTKIVLIPSVNNTIPTLVCEQYGFKITDQDMKTLGPKEWLNANIIDCYLTALMQKYTSNLYEESIFSSKDKIHLSYQTSSSISLRVTTT
jgi:Ulp1 family protease